MELKKFAVRTPCSIDVEGRILKMLKLDTIYPLEQIDWDTVNFDKGYEPTLRQLLEEDRRKGIDPWKDLKSQRTDAEAAREMKETAWIKQILSDLRIPWSDNRRALTVRIANRLIDMDAVQAKLLLSTDFSGIAKNVSNGDAELQSVFQQLQNVMELKVALYFDYENSLPM